MGKFAQEHELGVQGIIHSAQQLARIILSRIESTPRLDSLMTRSIQFFVPSYQNDAIQYAKKIGELCRQNVVTLQQALYLVRFCQDFQCHQFEQVGLNEIKDDVNGILVAITAQKQVVVDRLLTKKNEYQARLNYFLHQKAVVEAIVIAEVEGARRAKEVTHLPVLVYHHHALRRIESDCKDSVNSKELDFVGIDALSNADKICLYENKINKLRAKLIKLTIEQDILSQKISEPDIAKLHFEYVSDHLIDDFLFRLSHEEKKFLHLWYICVDSGGLGEKVKKDLVHEDHSDMLCIKEIKQIIDYHLKHAEDDHVQVDVNHFIQDRYNYIYEEVMSCLQKHKNKADISLLSKFYDPSAHFGDLIKEFLFTLEEIDFAIKSNNLGYLAEHVSLHMCDLVSEVGNHLDKHLRLGVNAVMPANKM